MQYKKFKDKRGRGLKQKTLFAKFKVENGKQKIYLNNRNDYPKVWAIYLENKRRRGQSCQIWNGKVYLNNQDDCTKVWIYLIYLFISHGNTLTCCMKK